jgi:hypothetical protein
MTLIPRNLSSELDPATRWLEHYEAVATQQRALAVGRRLRTRRPGPRRRQRMVVTVIALSVVLAGGALAVLLL